MTAQTYGILGAFEQLLRQGFKLDPDDPSSGNLVYDDSLDLGGAPVSGRSAEMAIADMAALRAASNSSAFRRRMKRRGDRIENSDTELVEDGLILD